MFLFLLPSCFGWISTDELSSDTLLTANRVEFYSEQCNYVRRASAEFNGGRKFRPSKLPMQ